MEWVSSFIDVFTKIAPLPLFVLAVSSAVCLFARDSFLARLGLLDFRNAQRSWIGVAFLLSSVYLLGHFAVWCYKGVSKLQAKWAAKREICERLQGLTGPEKDRLKHFILGQQRSCHFLNTDQVVLGLQTTGILARPGQVSLGSYNFETGMMEAQVVYNITGWAWDHLMEHPELICSEDELRKHFVRPEPSPESPVAGRRQ